MEYKIKEYRLLAKMTQEELARKSGVNRTTIVDLESGKEVNVTTKTLIKIAMALKVNINDIFF